ncbi:MAG TPA: hypothetical protein VMT17_17405 [Anaeromyxobacteraceae bacterium]|nr:hypothetical protein [Anaeromyxobacteraceae bacterium]
MASRVHVRSALAAALGFLQDEIESINAVRAPRVHRFLVDRDAARAVGAEPRAAEELLVAGAEDAVDVGLFLDDEAMAATAAAGLHRRAARLFARRRLDGVACVAEGVSHFVYFATRAEVDRPVSLLELEVQAEVDKFALFVLHLWRRGRRRLSSALRRRLFERVRYHPHLAPEELERYRTANGLAAGYARWLEGRFVARANADGLFRELRSTYRLGAGDKLGYLGSRG